MATNLYIAQVPYDRKYNHVINWINYTAQQNYFNAKKVLVATFDDKLLNPKGSVVELKTNYATFLDMGVNYIIVEETVNGKEYRWYAFILDVSRSSKDTVKITYELDYWNTYFFTDENSVKAVTSFKDAFVQRQHENRWTKEGSILKPIWSLTDENLEVGEMKLKGQTHIKNYLYEYSQGTLDLSEFEFTPYLVIYNDPNANAGEIDATRHPTIINGINQSSLISFLHFNIDLPSNWKIRFKTVGSGGTSYPLIDHTFNGTLSINTSSTYRTDSERVLKITKLTTLPFKLIIDTIDIVNKEMTITQYSNGGTIDLDEMLYEPKLIGTFCGAVKIRKLSLSVDNAQTHYELYPYIFGTTPNINNNSDWVNEPKLSTKSFTYMSIASGKSETYNIYYEYMPNNNMVEVKIIPSLDIWSYEDVYFKNYNFNDTFNRLRTKQNNEIPITSAAYLTYIMNNRNQIQTQQVLNTVQAVAGVGQIVAGATMPVGPLGKFGLIMSGANRLESGISAIAQEQAKQKDYKNKVDEVRTNANTLIMDTYTNYDLYKLSTYEVRPEFKERAYKLFMKQGYAVNKYIEQPNIDNRYYFNYVKCGYVELNPALIIEDSVRQVIESIYMRGVTLWHYRDSATFRFIDYTKENWETNLL